MTAVLPPSRITFPEALAQDALARSDEGVDPLPGDAELIAVYERFCQQVQERYESARYEAERRQQISDAIAEHEDDCYGDGCDHWTHEEA